MRIEIPAMVLTSGSRELLDNFTPSDPDMTPNGQGN